MDELAIALIQPEPMSRVLAHAIIQRTHLQRRSVQQMHELGRVFQCQVHMFEVLEPMALPALAHPLLHLGDRDGARHHRMHQLTENLAVDQFEVIQIYQLAIIQRLQFLVDLQDLGTPPGKRLEAGLVHAAVFPAAQEHQRLGGQGADAGRVDTGQETVLEQLDHKILQAWLRRVVAISTLDLLPQIFLQLTALDQLDAGIAPLGQLGQQVFQNGIQARLAARAHSQHLALHLCLRIARLQQFHQGVAALGRLKEDLVRFHQRVVIGPQAQFRQPQRHPIGLEDPPAGQLNIQQPVVQMGRFGPLPVQQELLLRLLSQHAVLHTELVVGQFDLFHLGQRQRFERAPEFPARVVPEHDALLVEQAGQRLDDSGVSQGPGSLSLFSGMHGVVVPELAGPARSNGIAATGYRACPAGCRQSIPGPTVP